MKTKPSVVIAFASLACAGLNLVTVARADAANGSSTGLVREVRRVTAAFHDVTNALAAGYASSGSCVSGPQEGAMGVHYPNGSLIFDGALDVARPEVLIYEQRQGRLRLLGVEYLVIAAEWHVNNEAPPMLMGQHFHYVGSPNRYGTPPFYELHVWAWKDNPHGAFVDWHPNVSCQDYIGE
jgi:hypothetical protein